MPNNTKKDKLSHTTTSNCLNPAKLPLKYPEQVVNLVLSFETSSKGIFVNGLMVLFLLGYQTSISLPVFTDYVCSPRIQKSN